MRGDWMDDAKRFEDTDKAIMKSLKDAYRYGPWVIDRNYSHALAAHAWRGIHDDYDGAPDASRSLRNIVFTGPTPEDVERQIRDAEDEA